MKFTCPECKKEYEFDIESFFQDDKEAQERLIKWFKKNPLCKKCNADFLKKNGINIKELNKILKNQISKINLKKEVKPLTEENPCPLCDGKGYYMKQPLPDYYLPSGNFGSMENEIKVMCSCTKIESKEEKEYTCLDCGGNIYRDKTKSYPLYCENGCAISCDTCGHSIGDEDCDSDKNCIHNDCWIPMKYKTNYREKDQK